MILNLFVAHPRVIKMLRVFRLRVSDKVCVIKPVGYLEMFALERSAALILTDSGGMQKEAFLLLEHFGKLKATR